MHMLWAKSKQSRCNGRGGHWSDRETGKLQLHCALSLVRRVLLKFARFILAPRPKHFRNISLVLGSFLYLCSVNLAMFFPPPNRHSRYRRICKRYRHSLIQTRCCSVRLEQDGQETGGKNGSATVTPPFLCSWSATERCPRALRNPTRNKQDALNAQWASSSRDGPQDPCGQYEECKSMWEVLLGLEVPS